MTDTAADSARPAPGGLNASAFGVRERTALVLLLLATFVTFLNETTMTVAIPRIMDDFHVTPSVGQWLTTAFALTMAVVIPVTGWLLQRVATRPLYVAAMTLFLAGTLVAALAPVFEILVVARVVQASGTAIMMPLMMTTVLTIVPPESRGRLMGRIAIVMAVAPAVGPSLAGLVLQFAGWRMIFWVMVPLAVVTIILGALRVPNVSELRRVPLDGLSVVLSGLAFGLLVYGLSALGTSAEGVGLLPPWLPVAVGATLLALFVWRQLLLQRRDAALLDLRTFRIPAFTIAIAMLAIGMVALFGMILIVPIYMMRGLGVEELTAGLVMLPGSLLMGLLGPVVGRLYDRFGPRPLVVPGTIATSAAYWCLSLVTEATPIPFLVAAHLLLSLGLSFLFTPLFTAGLGSLPSSLYSHGSATVATLQQVGGAAGTALFAALYSIGVIAAGGGDPSTTVPTEVAAGVRLVFLVGGIVTLVLVALAFFVRRPDDPVAPPPAPAD